MATAISNSVLLDEIDFIAAVAKAMANIYTATYDGFDFMVREQNPDDLGDGVDAAVAVRTKLQAGTGVHTQFSNLTQWLAARASAAGSSGVDALLTTRGLRVPYSYDQYVNYPNASSHLNSRNIFYDTDITLGRFTDDSDVYSAGTQLTMSGSHNWMVVQADVTIDSAWVLSVPVYYGDGSTGTEVSFSGALQHSYSTGGYGIRLVRQLVSADTTSGGGAGFTVTFKTKSERTITQ